jgi:hypothetical protein
MTIEPNGYWKNESEYHISQNGINYIREECKMNGNFHTIEWNFEIPDEDHRTGGPLHYYSIDKGWSNPVNNRMSLTQPAPELEVEFQRIIILNQ